MTMLISSQRERTGPHRVLALAALALPTLLVAIDIAVMAVALPSLARDLNPSSAQLLWITDSYNFLVAGSMLTTGALADRIGRRKMIMICAAVFAVASGVGAFATTAGMVILVRAVMGVAGSAIMPASMSLIGTLFTGEERMRNDPEREQKARVQAMGAYMTVFLLGMAVAPFVGGVLIDAFWWGAVFLIGVPVMLVTMAVVPMLLPESRSEAAPRIDLVSTAQSLAAILGLVYALKTAVNDGVGVSVWVALVLGVVAGAAFVRRQLRLENPLVDVRLLAGSRVGRVLAVLFLTALLMGGSSLFFNLYLQDVQGLSPLQAAWWMLPQAVAMIAASNVGPLLNRRLSGRTVLLSMLAVMTCGFAFYGFLPVDGAGLPMVAVGSALATFGIGASFPLLMDQVMSTAPPERAGAGAALAQLSNELGIAVGLTVLGLLGTVLYRSAEGVGDTADVVDGVTRAGSDPSFLEAVRAAFTDSYNVVGFVGVAVMVVVLVLTARTHRRVAA